VKWIGEFAGLDPRDHAATDPTRRNAVASFAADTCMDSAAAALARALGVRVDRLEGHGQSYVRRIEEH